VPTGESAGSQFDPAVVQAFVDIAAPEVDDVFAATDSIPFDVI
jgi:hypothetical protein